MSHSCVLNLRCLFLALPQSLENVRLEFCRAGESARAHLAMHAYPPYITLTYHATIPSARVIVSGRPPTEAPCEEGIGLFATE
jgi:hypothetical protein